MIENINQKENLLNENEINFSSIKKLVLRNKLFVGSISLISLLLAIIYSFTLKRVWEGQFQIVLNNEEENISKLNPLVAIGLIAKTNDLKTEVEILQSPSVLMPIFNYSLSLKDKSQQEGSFSDWKKILV